MSRRLTGFRKEDQNGGAQTMKVIIPAWETCNLRNDDKGMRFASWCQMIGFPTGVPVPNEIADLIVLAHACHVRDGGHFSDGECGNHLQVAWLRKGQDW
jgi:hypothetical protein